MRVSIPAIAFRNIFRNIPRSVLSALAITLSVFGILFLFAFGGGYLDNLKINVKNYISGDMRIRHADYDRYEQLLPLHLGIQDPGGLVGQIQRLDGVESALIRIPFGGGMYIDGETEAVELVGVDFAAAQNYLGIQELLERGALPQAGANEAVVGDGFLARFGLELGDKVTVVTTTRTRGSNAFTVKLVGVIDFPYPQLDNGQIMLPLGRAQYFLRMQGSATEILVKADAELGQSEVDELRARVASLLGSDQIVLPWQEIGTVYSLIRTTNISYFVMALIFFVLASTVIANTTLMVIFERKNEIGMLGALGASRKSILGLFYFESIIVGVIGAAVGVGLGIGLVAFLSKHGIDLSSQIEGTGLEVSSLIYPRLTIGITVGVFFYAVAVVGATTLLPTLRAVKIKIVEALRVTA